MINLTTPRRNKDKYIKHSYYIHDILLTFKASKPMKFQLEASYISKQRMLI